MICHCRTLQCLPLCQSSQFREWFAFRTRMERSYKWLTAQFKSGCHCWNFAGCWPTWPKKNYENKTETIAERDTLIGQRESLSNRQVFLETALLNTYFDASSFLTTQHCFHYYRYETWSEWIDDYNIRFVCFLLSLF